MQNKFLTIPAWRCPKPVLLAMLLFLPAFAADLLAQSCDNKIENNIIEAKLPICVNTLAWLQGSTPTGGDGRYTYQWQVSLKNCSEGHFASIPGATGKDYMVPVFLPLNACFRRLVFSGNCADNSNKIKIELQVLIQPIPPQIATIDPTCALPTGSITATSPAPNSSFSIDGVNYANTSGTFSGLIPNQYGVTVKYSTGCLSPVSVVTIKPLPVLTGSISPTSGVLCGNGGGGIKLTATGGATYQWYRDGIKINGAMAADYYANEAGTYTAELFNGACKGKTSNKAVLTQGIVPTGSITPSAVALCAGSSSGTKLTASGGLSYQWYRNGEKIAGATDAMYQAMQAGTYTADIFNATCQGKTDNKAVVTQNDAIAFATAVTDPSCTVAFGEINVQTVTGGSGKGYQYSKDNGQTFQTANTFSNLAPGNYKIVVKDDIGCTSNAVAAVVHSFTSTLAATTTVTSITCTQSTGSVNVAATGGTAPYQYSVDGNAFGSGNVIGGLVAGLHKVKVKDTAGCTVEAAFTIIVINSTLSGTATVVDATCKEKGSAAAKASGGEPPYTYSFDGGSFQSALTVSGLSAGNHTLIIKDNAGCKFTVPFAVKFTGTYPKLVVTDSIIVCPSNTINLTDPAVVKGSDANLLYTYWNDTTASTPVPTPAAVPAGTYFIKAVNEQGCASIKPIAVLQHNLPEGKIILSGSSNVCFGQTVTLTASIGKAYQWYLNDAPINGATASVYQAAVAGNYSVSINDSTCSAFAANTVQVQFISCASNPETSVVVPTAFTPNKNGANDVLRPIFYNVASLQFFEVYNRWGQLVFRTAQMGKGWDGTIGGVPQPTETYTWILQCTDNAGNVIKQSGRSLLLR